MIRYTARRLLLVVPVLIGASVLVFLSVFALPGDPVATIGGREPAPETRAAIEHKYHLDQPIWTRYGYWATGVVRGDLGDSYATRRSVDDMIGDALPNTLRLAAFAVLIEAVIGIGAGILAAITHRRWLDALIVLSTTVLVAIPFYVLGTALQYMFGLRWQLLPISGVDDGFKSWILPALVLALPSLAYVTRLTRSTLDDTEHQGYVEMATAKGLSPRRVAMNHRARNALIPVVTFLAIECGALLAGALFVETLFNINGMGQVLVKSIAQRDANVVVGCTLVFVAGFLLVNLVADLVVGALDPRVRDG